MGRAGFFSGSGRAGLLGVALGPGRALKSRAGPGSGFFQEKSHIIEIIQIYFFSEAA